MALIRRLGIKLSVYHIEGVANELADVLSRTVHRNYYRIKRSVLDRICPAPDFDLFGNAEHAYAPAFPLHSLRRRHNLGECPRLPKVSVGVPPWSYILGLLSSAQDLDWNLRRVLLVLPYWPGQIWWPLARSLGHLWLLQGQPWLNPWSRSQQQQPRWRAVALPLGPPSWRSVV